MTRQASSSPDCGTSRRQREQLRNLRHELANSLYSITLQVHCAEVAIDEGEIQAARQNLGQITAAVGHTRDQLDDLLAAAGLDRSADER